MMSRVKTQVEYWKNTSAEWEKQAKDAKVICDALKTENSRVRPLFCFLMY